MQPASPRSLSRLLLERADHARAFGARILKWLGELWIIWVGFLALAAITLSFIHWKPCDLSYRVVGMVAQLFAIVLVIVGLLKIRTLFLLTPYLQILRDWVGRRPTWRRDITMPIGSGAITLEGVTLDARGKVHFDRTKPVDEQLEALARDIEVLRESIAVVDKKHSASVETMAADIKAVAEKVTHETEKIGDKLKRVQTEGVSLSLVGAALVVLGTVLTAMPVELAFVFGNPAPTCTFPPTK